jgi:hypothetical protein
MTLKTEHFVFVVRHTPPGAWEQREDRFYDIDDAKRYTDQCIERKHKHVVVTQEHIMVSKDIIYPDQVHNTEEYDGST